MINSETPPRPRGRPRAFDREAALAQAADTFWKLGYEGASIADLTAAMGITPQSLYAAFSSKAELYRQALAQYQAHAGETILRPLTLEPHAVVALARVLREAASRFTAPGRPRGCMVSTALLSFASENEAPARLVSAMRESTLALLKERIERGISDGHFRPETDAAALARFIGAIIQGMAVQARDGASESALRGLAEHAVSEIARHRA